MTEIVTIATLIIAALSMSVHFGTWLTERPMRTTTSGAVFTQIQQGRDAIAAKVMPVCSVARRSCSWRPPPSRSVPTAPL